MKGYLRKIIEFSSVDGDGNRTVIFLQGCNFNCLYCHNPETIYIVKDSKPKNVEFIDSKEIVKRALKYRDFIKGVTISGGECTVQFEFLLEIIKKFKLNDIEVYLDTNGSFSFKEYNILKKYVDKFMFDLKSFDLDEHIMLTGMDNSNVIKNLKMALRDDKVYEVRTVIVPKLLNNYRNVYKTSKLISDYKVRYKLIKYRENGVRKRYRNYMTPSSEYMDELAKVVLANCNADVIVV